MPALSFARRLRWRTTLARWVRDHGLEWAWLSLRRPRRFFERYLVGNPTFIAQVVRERLTTKSGHSRPH